MSELAKKKCVPCEGGIKPMTPEEAQKTMSELGSGWMLIDEAHLLVKEFTLKDFAEAFALANKIAKIAEEEGHHPDLSIGYGRLGVELTTHAIEGLSENDFIVAAKIDELQN